MTLLEPTHASNVSTAPSISDRCVFAVPCNPSSPSTRPSIAVKSVSTPSLCPIIISCFASIDVNDASRATKSVWFAEIKEFILVSISPFFVKILLLICPKVSPVPSVFADILF